MSSTNLRLFSLWLVYSSYLLEIPSTQYFHLPSASTADRVHRPEQEAEILRATERLALPNLVYNDHFTLIAIVMQALWSPVPK
jgi:hypothetical protein